MVEGRKQEFLDGFLVVTRYAPDGRYYVLHPASASVLQTDGLGAYAALLFIRGRGSVDIAGEVKRRCPGAEERWWRLVDALRERGVVSVHRNLKSSRRLTRSLVALGLGALLSTLNAAVGYMPVSLLKLVYDAIPHSPLGRYAFRRLRGHVEANLCAAGFAELNVAQRNRIAREVSDATVRTRLWTYYSRTLAEPRLRDLAQAVIIRRTAGSTRQIVEAAGGAIVVGVHWDTFQALLPRLNAVRPVTVLTYAGRSPLQHNLASDGEPRKWHFARRVDGYSRMAARTLLAELQAGRIVVIAFDVAPRGTFSREASRRISFLEHSIARFDLIGWLAIHSGKPILVADVARRNRRLEVDLSLPIESTSESTPAELTSRVYRYVEERIREHPGSWLTWSHLQWVTPVFGSKTPDTCQDEKATAGNVAAMN